MGHRPFPNAERSRRYVDARHGSCCPRCGHYASVHPFQRGQFVCRRTREGMPSCRECAARLMQSKAGPLRGFAENAARVQITMLPMPSLTPSSGLAVRSAMASVKQAFPSRA